jgi:hypothetical protein
VTGLVPGSKQLFAALGSRVDGRRGRRRSPRFFLPVLLAGVIGLCPLAYASPPDPVWIHGFYDDADHDDVIVLLTNSAAVIDPPPVRVGHLCLVAGLPASLYASAPSGASVLAVRLRSPPIV